MSDVSAIKRSIYRLALADGQRTLDMVATKTLSCEKGVVRLSTNRLAKVGQMWEDESVLIRDPFYCEWGITLGRVAGGD